MQLWPVASANVTKRPVAPQDTEEVKLKAVYGNLVGAFDETVNSDSVYAGEPMLVQVEEGDIAGLPQWQINVLGLQRGPTNLPSRLAQACGHLVVQPRADIWLSECGWQTGRPHQPYYQ